MDVDARIKQLEVEACLAVRSGKIDSAERTWQSMLIHAKIQRDEPKDISKATIIKSLQNFLIFASRSHRDELFETWLMPTWKNICNLAYPKELGDFVNAIAFVIADRKLFFSLEHLDIIFKQFVRMCNFYKWDLTDFYKEWVTTMAEITSRNVDDISRKMVILLLKGLYHCNDWKMLQGIMWQYYMHMQSYAQYNGYEKTFVAYGRIHYLEILLSERIDSMPDGDEKIMQARMLYCGIRDWLANVARVTKRDEAVTINEWYKFVQIGARPKLQKRFQKLFATEMEFWKYTRPQTYAKIKSL